jgi:RNA polymerase sigma factor (sigma-70 family)
MTSSQQITHWLNQLKVGDHDSVEPLMEHYFQRLIHLASSRLKGRSSLQGYDEDVALSAFKSLCHGVQVGKFNKLDNRDDLWRLLVVLTVRKAVDLTRRASARKEQCDMEDIGYLLSGEPTPELAAQIADEVSQWLEHLKDDELRRIAMLRVEGHTAQEIADELGCVVRTVERKLQRIRRCWEEFL